MKFRFLNNFAKPAPPYQLKHIIKIFTQAFSKDDPSLPSPPVLYWLCDPILVSECIGGIRQASPTSPASFAPHLFATSPSPQPAYKEATHTHSTQTQAFENTHHVLCLIHIILGQGDGISKSLGLNDLPLILSIREGVQKKWLF